MGGTGGLSGTPERPGVLGRRRGCWSQVGPVGQREIEVVGGGGKTSGVIV